jgi:hypothetical protein
MKKFCGSAVLQFCSHEAGIARRAFGIVGNAIMPAGELPERQKSLKKFAKKFTLWHCFCNNYVDSSSKYT